MKKIIESLETIAQAVEKNADIAKIKQMINVIRADVGAALVAAQSTQNGQAQGLPLQELDHELSIWQSKLDVILKEPVGKIGMAKHARHWAEKLKTCSQ